MPLTEQVSLAMEISPNGFHPIALSDKAVAGEELQLVALRGGNDELVGGIAVKIFQLR